jgi:hypothetical protein
MRACLGNPFEATDRKVQQLFLALRARLVFCLKQAPENYWIVSSMSERLASNLDRGNSDVSKDSFSRINSELLNVVVVRVRRGLQIGLCICVFVATFWVGWIGGSTATRLFNQSNSDLIANLDFRTVVEQIISAESNGDANKKNRRSSATGPAQFLDETWLEMMATHRPDLVEGHTRMELLELRRDQELSREITTRLVERNAKILSKRSLPVTPGTLYLAHFAGPAGAVAVLSVPENEHAASIMASADATRRTTPEKIILANPFIGDFTVADLKRWADRKMQGSKSVLANASTSVH